MTTHTRIARSLAHVATVDDYAAECAADTPVRVWRLGDGPSSFTPTDGWDETTMLGADGLHPNDAGMDYLATVYADALSDAGLTPAAGTTCWAYGDSWTAADTNNTVGRRAIVQFASALGLTLTNKAVSGYSTDDVAGTALAGNTYAPGASQMVFYQAGVNNLKNADQPAVRAAVTEGMRAFFATVCAAERIEDSAFTYSGTWTNHASGTVGASGGSNHATTADGSSATYTITTPGTYYLFSHATDPAGSLVGGQLTVTQGATTLAVADLDDKHFDTGFLMNSDYGPIAIRLDNVQTGTLTVTFNTLGRTSAQGWIDALMRQSSTPPLILAAKVPPVTEATRQQPWLLQFIRDQLDVMHAEFGATVVLADPAPDVDAEIEAELAVEETHTNPGVYVGDPTRGVDGIPGSTTTAVTFGAGKYVDLGNVDLSAYFAGVGNGFTVELWCKGSWGSSSFATLISNSNTSWRLARNSTGVGARWEVTPSGASAASNTVNVGDGNWHHIVGVYQQEGSSTRRVTLYVDGVSRANTLTGAPSTAWTARIAGNVAAPTLVTPMTIDEVRIYPSALSATRILAHYNAGITP